LEDDRLKPVLLFDRLKSVVLGMLAELTTNLISADADTRAAAAEALAQMATAAAPAAVSLVEACRDDDERVREWAVAALEDMGPPLEEAVKPLTLLVGDANPLAAYWAATLLGRCGEGAASAVDALAKGVDSGVDSSVRQRAAWALGQIGPAASATRGVLEKAAGSADERLARLAKAALAGLEETG
jgi:HEAT repeat protein